MSAIWVLIWGLWERFCFQFFTVVDRIGFLVASGLMSPFHRCQLGVGVGLCLSRLPIFLLMGSLHLQSHRRNIKSSPFQLRGHLIGSGSPRYSPYFKVDLLRALLASAKFPLSSICVNIQLNQQKRRILGETRAFLEFCLP